MSKDWSKIAKAEFEAMPADYKKDWQGLRRKLLRQQKIAKWFS